MIVVCKRGTNRLVKGARYKVDGLWNDGTNQRWLEGKLFIRGFGRYVVGNFTDENGSPVPRINIAMPQQAISRPDFNQIKAGDIMVCTSGAYKSLVEGGMYQVESKIENNVSRGSWKTTERHIKFVGQKRNLVFNPWRFRLLSAQETREMSLGQLLHNEADQVIREKPKKKIDLVPNKEEMLIGILLRSAVDPKRHAISIVEWACQKVAPNMDLVPEDFAAYLSMSLADVIDRIDQTKKSL